MSVPPLLKLFGIPVFMTLTGHVVFTSERPFQLLAYLACRRQWVGRDELADLLWPEHDAANARSNLRKVLLLAGRVPGVTGIQRQGDLLRWAPDSDLARFEAACDDGRFDAAVELGAAPLLEGLDTAFLGTGAEWLAGERQRVAARWQGACMQRLTELAARPREAIRLARRMLDRDPLDEAAVEALARVHLELGEADIAASAIAAYARQLADSMSLEPSAALRDLADAARATSQPTAPAPAAAQGDIAFIGRRRELGEIVALLEQPLCRLVTITGPGGIGKSSTARAVADRLVPAIVETVVVVPMADLTELDQLPARVAACLGDALSGTTEPWSQIAALVAARPLALVLDNAEQLKDIGTELERLLAAVPRLKLLVTSRSRLGVASETTFGLDGLPLPDEDETDVEVLRRCDAVALFESRAVAASRKFDLQAHAADVVRLVHRVEGLPLAIELAAIWSRILPVREIADELAESIDLLESDSAPERGFRASFAQSWRLLSDNERACLPSLALLPGDFTRVMAQQVASAPLPVLAALVDRSLLRSDGNGRFSMHPLLRRCAAEQRGADEEAIMARLAAFVARWLGDFSKSEARIGATLLDAIERELAHVRAAWAWALAHRDTGVVVSIARPMSTFFVRRGMWVEGAAAFTGALEAFADSGVSGERARAVSYRELAMLQCHSGALDAAEASARQVVAFAQSAGDGQMLMAAFNTIGLSLRQRGRYAEARQALEQALQHAQKEGAVQAMVAYSVNIAIVDTSLGRYQDALEAYEGALASERAANQPERASTLVNIANAYRALDRPDLGTERLNEALVICTQHNLKSTRAFVLAILGLCHLEMGHGAVAKTWLDRALEESRQWGEPLVEVETLLALASLDADVGETAAARVKVWQALSIADRVDSMALRVQCVAEFGAIFIREGRVQDGLALMRWSLARPDLDRFDRDITARRLAKLVPNPGGVDGEPSHLPIEAPIVAVLTLVAAAPN